MMSTKWRAIATYLLDVPGALVFSCKNFSSSLANAPRPSSSRLFLSSLPSLRRKSVTSLDMAAAVGSTLRTSEHFLIHKTHATDRRLKHWGLVADIQRLASKLARGSLIIESRFNSLIRMGGTCDYGILAPPVSPGTYPR